MKIQQVNAVMQAVRTFIKNASIVDTTFSSDVRSLSKNYRVQLRQYVSVNKQTIICVRGMSLNDHAVSCFKNVIVMLPQIFHSDLNGKNRYETNQRGREKVVRSVCREMPALQSEVSTRIAAYHPCPKKPPQKRFEKTSCLEKYWEWKLQRAIAQWPSKTLQNQMNAHGTLSDFTPFH